MEDMRKSAWKKVLSIFAVLMMTIGTWGTAYAEELDNTEISLADEPSENYEAIEDEIASAADIKTYDIAIDYSTMDAAAVCFVRMGQSYVTAKIEDESGTVIGTVGAADVQPKRWVFINKPSQDASIVHYTVTVSGQNYVQGSGQFRLIYGNKNDVEAMISGPENATPIEWFTNTKDNFFHTRYTPNKGECWYRFTAEQSSATVTLLGSHPETRFRVVDADHLGKVFDSNDPVNSDAHKNTFCGAFQYGEKSKVQRLTVGQDYFLIIYASDSFSPLNLVGDTINVSVGMPHMASGMTEWISASNQISATTSAFSADGIVFVGDGGDTIPRTAYATKIYFSSEAKPSAIAYWRVKTPSGTSWKQSGNFRTSVDIDYKKDANTNTLVEGIWRVGCKASSSTQRITPVIRFSYQYELGD